MLRLTGTVKLQVVADGADTTSRVTVSFMDWTPGGATSAGTQVNPVNSTTPVDICTAPTGSIIRDIDHVKLVAAVARTFTFSVNDGSAEKWDAVTLAVGDVFEWAPSGAFVKDSTGAKKYNLPGFVAASGKTLTVSNSLTLAGTDGTTMTFPTTSATIARTDVGNAFLGNNTFNALTKINANAAALPAPAGGTLLHLGNADNTNTRVTIDGFGSGFPTLTFRRADTSAANPSAVQSADTLGILQVFGYGATGYSSSARAAWSIQASQIWTDANQGTKQLFQTTPNNSTTLTTALTLDQDQSATFAGLINANAGISVPTGQNITGTGTAAISGFASVSAGTFNSGASASGYQISVQAAIAKSRLARTDDAAGYAFYEVYPNAALSGSSKSWAAGLFAGDNSYHIWTFDGSSAVDRLTITNAGVVTVPGTLVATLTTAAQPNITSTGALSVPTLTVKASNAVGAAGPSTTIFTDSGNTTATDFYSYGSGYVGGSLYNVGASGVVLRAPAKLAIDAASGSIQLGIASTVVATVTAGAMTIAGTLSLGSNSLTAGSVGINASPTATSKLHIAGLPTSSAGLASGDVWLNSNVLTIVP